MAKLVEIHKRYKVEDRVFGWNGAQRSGGFLKA
jgi:hypothetical protein